MNFSSIDTLFVLYLRRVVIASKKSLFFGISRNLKRDLFGGFFIFTLGCLLKYVPLTKNSTQIRKNTAVSYNDPSFELQMRKMTLYNI